eukprot:CAMPEP_0197028132 /NCGR_PEP_ID=MMETSP1384-20130603/7897_1 /TAXON_ID=29189 /ORGANISM="Ammonia sp." /LENGTH=1169 /DNA_ID=CAMNT_0042457085 /DNA_START=95 /DNA_END=3604 /DNA_ORIENTATION=-
MTAKYDFTKDDNIRVIARFRPSSETERREEKIQGLEDNEPKFRSTQEVVMKRLGKDTGPAFKAVLDHLFKMSTQQKKIFDLVGRPMVQAVLEGYNATIFAYGQTGSGKTYTMFGPEKRKNELDLGLVQRCCTYLFDKLKKLTGGEVTEWQVTASFIQIYKEHLSDLLEPSSRNLQIRTNFQTDTPYVENLKSVSVNNIEDVLINLGIAFSNRIVASHKLNSTSSRSHMLLMLNIEQKTRDGAVKRSKLNFGDLAGSEDIRKALGDNPDPERMKEAIAINSSLTSLTTAINNLSRGQRPSYRSSPLTHILQDSLGGNAKTTMFVAASPHVLNRAETIRTLRFAMTAKTVKNKAKINKELTRAQLMRRIEELETMNARLKARVIELETQMQAAGMEVELSTELYDDGGGGGADWSSGDDDDEDDGKEAGGAKKKKKKGAKGKPGAAGPTDPAKKKANLSIDDGGGVSQASTHQIEVLKKEIDAAQERLQGQTKRNAELEQRTMDLSAEIDAATQQLHSQREMIEEMSKTSANFGKERQLLETRNEELQKELDSVQATMTKQTGELDRQIQRQRNNIQMRTNENKELQKYVKELNLQNEDLLKQNDLLQKQMNALKRQAYKNNPELAKNLPMDDDTLALVQDLDQYVLAEEEKQMEPGELLLHRFAAAEANDFRLTSEQRMKKTAKMMTDMSDDINSLMSQWLPKNKVRQDRVSSKTLVFQVRQLIGHFNVLVKQMKQNEESFQNDLKLDIKRRDQEIKKLKEETKTVHQLQDDLEEKNEVIEQLKKHRDDLRVERDHLKAQTVEQQDMIFDVQNQVRYLNTELERNRSTIVELQAKKEKDAENAGGLDLQQILDGEEPPTSSDEDEDDESDSEETPKKKVKSVKQQVKPKKKKGGHAPQQSEEIMYMSDEDEDEEDNKASKRNGGGKDTFVIHEHEVTTEADTTPQSNGGAAVTSNGAEANANQEEEAKAEHKPPAKTAKKAKSSSRRKSTMSMWRESLKPGDQLDCKDESGLWWTAKVIDYKGNSDKLVIRYDGWGDGHDETIGRESDRLAVFKSMCYLTDKGGNKLIREGFMSKEGKMFKTWRKRYFKLDEQGQLSYFHNKEDENPIGSIDIRLMSKTERISFGRNKQFGIQIHTENRVWKFLCGSEKDVAEWIHALNFVKRGNFAEDD